MIYNHGFNASFHTICMWIANFKYSFISWKEKLQKKICTIYGDGAIAESTACKLFARFKSVKFDLED